MTKAEEYVEQRVASAMGAVSFVGVVETPEELLADRAYVLIRDLLITLEIAPGSVINEEVLGRTFGMGRTPIREALKRLRLIDEPNGLAAYHANAKQSGIDLLSANNSSGVSTTPTKLTALIALATRRSTYSSALVNPVSPNAENPHA